MVHFVPNPAPAAGQRLVQPQTTLTACQHGAIAYEPFGSDAAAQDFTGILFGDCTGNWRP